MNSTEDYPIGFFDSGIGGTSIWKEVHELLPNENTIYLADSKNAPYGDKSKDKISKERGKWKEVIINNKTYLTMVTFHPAYLLRQADQKKYSWADLKIIRKKIDELGIKF